MKLAFYYHIPGYQWEKNLFFPSYIGVFIDSLAEHIETLYVVFHQASKGEIAEADYKLKSKNVTFINLGVKTPAWHREIFHRRILKQKLKEVNKCDAFIIRSPSPLAPYFPQYLNGVEPLFMIVGDYMESVKQWKPQNFRDRLMLIYLKYNDWKFRRVIKNFQLVVNSPALFEKYKNGGRSIALIKTTTLSEKDFFEREDTCQGSSIQLVYTGRIDPLKGLYELIDAVALLLRENVKVILNIAGWEYDESKSIEKKLVLKISELGINKQVFFHGRKTVGDELNAIYRMGDIYIIASHEEGFPRTIWEAMANGLPVITTNVGGIPKYLTDQKNALLINPKSVDEIVNAVKTLIYDKELRKQLIFNGLTIAKENTLEVQTLRLIEILKNNK